MQIKQVLNIFFGEIVDQISKKHRYAQYNLILPTEQIPRSRIAKQLYKSISRLISDDDYDDDHSTTHSLPPIMGSINKNKRKHSPFGSFAMTSLNIPLRLSASSSKHNSRNSSHSDGRGNRHDSSNMTLSVTGDNCNNNNNYNEQNMKTVDIISQTVCEKIIIAFRSMYRKYIDSYNATFMINISSRNRDKLMKLFDSDHYHTLLRQERRASSMKSVASLNELLQFWKESLNESKKNYNQNVDNKSQINHQLKQYIDDKTKESMQDGNAIFFESELYYWILKKVMLAMEPSVFEISSLMSDSFTRFKNQQRELYQEIAEIAENIYDTAAT